MLQTVSRFFKQIKHSRKTVIFRLAIDGRILWSSVFVEETLKNAGGVYGHRTRMQSASIDLSAIIAVACLYLSIEAKELARRFNADRSAISQATQSASRDPE
jgi:hypothetical protein